jgi:hypothetical protein
MPVEHHTPARVAILTARLNGGGLGVDKKGWTTRPSLRVARWKLFSPRLHTRFQELDARQTADFCHYSRL